MAGRSVRGLIGTLLKVPASEIPMNIGYWWANTANVFLVAEEPPSVKSKSYTCHPSEYVFRGEPALK